MAEILLFSAGRGETLNSPIDPRYKKGVEEKKE
jgi:hypothetical protein